MRMKRMTEDFPLKWLICIPNISAVRGNVVFETLHDFYRTAIKKILLVAGQGSVLFCVSVAISSKPVNFGCRCKVN